MRAPYGLSTSFWLMRCSVCKKSTEPTMRMLNARSYAIFKTENDCSVAEKHLFRVAMGCRCSPNALKSRRSLRILALGMWVDCMHRHEHGRAARGLPRARFARREHVELSKSLFVPANLATFGRYWKSDAVLGWVPVRVRRDADSGGEDGLSPSDTWFSFLNNAGTNKYI